MDYRKLYNVALDFMYRSCDTIHSIKYWLPYFQRYRLILKPNKEFKNCLEGKRCFIIGNGPSLKEQNLSILKDEIVMTVNKSMLMEEYASLHSNFHFWGDERYFVEENVELMKKVNTSDNSPICFFPWYKYDFVRQHSLNDILNVRYLPDGDLPYTGYNRKIDFTRRYFNSYTVVFTAISFAIYCGINEIYLLGCDCTNIISYVEHKLKENITGYAYEVTEEEKRKLDNMPPESNEITFQHQAELFRAYSILKNYCSRRNIKLINCSPKSILDEIPWRKFEDIIN